MDSHGQPRPPTELVVEALRAAADNLQAIPLPPDPSRSRPDPAAFGHTDAAAAMTSFYDTAQASWHTLTADHAAMIEHLRDCADTYHHTDTHTRAQLTATDIPTPRQPHNDVGPNTHDAIQERDS